MTFTITELMALLAVVAAFTAILVTIALWVLDKKLAAKPDPPKITVRHSLVKSAPRYTRVNIHFDANEGPWVIDHIVVKTRPVVPIYDLTELYNWNVGGSYTFHREKLHLASAKTIFEHVGILEKSGLTHSFTIGLIIDSNEVKSAIKLKAKIHLSLETNIKKARKVTVKRQLVEHTKSA